jgi:SAM-dependent methyltransferase
LSTPRLPWAELEAAFHEAVAANFTTYIAPDQQHYDLHFAFARSRLNEGRDLIAYCDTVEPLRRRELRCLDIGAGNGGIALAFANVRRMRVDATDILLNPSFTRAIRATRLPLRRTVSRAGELPYRDASFDLVLLIDVLEHVRERRHMGSEVMRVLKPGGVAFITTPARIRYFHRPDPHYGVRGLLALPNFAQRLVVNRVLGMRTSTAQGSSIPAYDVEHTFWHYLGIARLFPGRESVEPLFAFPMVGGPVFSREWLRRKLRGFLFHHVVIRKAG